MDRRGISNTIAGVLGGAGAANLINSLSSAMQKHATDLRIAGAVLLTLALVIFVALWLTAEQKTRKDRVEEAKLRSFITEGERLMERWILEDTDQLWDETNAWSRRVNEHLKRDGDELRSDRFASDVGFPHMQYGSAKRSSRARNWLEKRIFALGRLADDVRR